MKVLFLDIDGVLNSTKTSVASGGYPGKLSDTDQFDWMAIRLLQRMCDSSGVQVVLSSAWRIAHSAKEVAQALGLPIIDATAKVSPHGYQRGYEIQDWLDAHPEVTQYAILDDDADMLESQMACFIKTDPHEGMTWASFARLCSVLGVSPFEGEARDRNWREGV